jgi:XTP/dITP diphosphohydrolase
VKLVFATRNPGKLRELRQLLSHERLEVIGLEDFPDAPEIEENGASFAENAVAKAVGIMRATGLPSLADDSGLEVDALGGAPGVHSARYAGPGASDADRVVLLLQNLRGVPPENRTARFRCAVAFVEPRDPDRVEVREGTCEGRILGAPRGTGGFGYDPVFYAEEIEQTFAEAPAEIKNRLSHRGQAMRQMAAYLEERLRGPAGARPG